MDAYSRYLIACVGLSAPTLRLVRREFEAVFDEPGHPEQNGRHERMHLTLKQDTAMPPARSRRAQQRRFDVLRRDYNELRPHESLDQQPPALFYAISSRRLPRPAWGRDFVYPDDVGTGRVNKSG